MYRCSLFIVGCRYCLVLCIVDRCAVLLLVGYWCCVLMDVGCVLFVVVDCCLSVVDVRRCLLVVGVRRVLLFVVECGCYLLLCVVWCCCV